MNILIPYSWLKDYVKTELPAEKLAETLSLHSFSVERIIDADGDKVFEIETTPNRYDALSVLGIARELRAILPIKTFSSKIKSISREKLPIQKSIIGKEELRVVINDKNLVPRFSAIILDGVEIKESPPIIKERLAKVNIKPLNNIIDITNYLMIDKGQPMHAFDFDKIGGGKIIVRESNKDEKIITLDDKTRELPDGAIVIEDGRGRLIDLCGIMGAKNSAVDENTKKVLLFAQIYDPVKIRKASMALGHRTEAALRFERGVDSAGVLPALQEAVDMAKESAGAKVCSKLIDITGRRRDKKIIKIDYKKISVIAGIEISKSVIEKSLKSLGFKIKKNSVVVPSWRLGDINISEDLAEEVIRLYGYQKLPSLVHQGELPKTKVNPGFYWEDRVKDLLKHLGFFECFTYSATSQSNAGQNSLALLNPLSQEATHLKTSLTPQLLEIIGKNLSYSDKIKIFELASVYLPTQDNLPNQPLRLALATKGVAYLELKGVIEALLQDMGVEPGVINTDVKKFNDECLAVEIDFDEATAKANRNKKYAPAAKFNPIKEDMTFAINPKLTFQEIQKAILETDAKIHKLEFKYIYKSFITLSLQYLDKQSQISPEYARNVRERIIETAEKKLGMRLKK